MADADDIDNLPSTPEDAAADAVTVASVKALISEKLYNELTDGVDTLTERAIVSAQLKAESLLNLVHQELNLEDETHAEIVAYLAVYKLYVFVGDYRGGKEYLVTATELVSAKYGKGEETLLSAPVPSGAVAKPVHRRRLP